MVKALRGDDGVWCCDQGTLRDLAYGYYKSLFTSCGVDCSNYLIRGFFPPIDVQSLLPLTAPVLDEEVRKVIFAMEPLKAPDSIGIVSVLDCSQRLVDSYNLTLASSLGLQHARDLGVRHVLVEVDSLVVVKMVSDNHIASGDALTRMDSKSVGGYGIFLTPPSVVCEVLRQDMQSGGMVVARPLQEVQHEMPTSGVG
ncbi:hypothetical protein V6N11_025423 [Hibiscus sabdariffa]|uniref:RNase H type-1 domain-containing protein n=1 Tax=Hibiscus sabdariffa TaxID=183260 RepID=A0ABR1ZF65_9ROSI